MDSLKGSNCLLRIGARDLGSHEGASTHHCDTH